MSGLLNIAEFVSLRAARQPQEAALIDSGGILTWRELDLLTGRAAAGLVDAGIEKGTRTVLMVRPGREFLVLTFALIRVGAVLILIDPGIGWKRLGQCLREARPEAFAGIPAAHLVRILLRWGRASIRTSVTLGRFPIAADLTYRRLLRHRSLDAGAYPLIDPDAAAAIVFTSGSTGVPKGVVYTHRMFSAQARLLKEHFNISGGEIDLATFPLFALFDAALGMTTIFPRMDFTRPGHVDPRAIIGPIRRHGVTHLFGSPALLDRVGRFAESNGIRLDSLKRVLSAGAPVPDAVLARFQGLLASGADLHTPYGATEALPICSISAKERLRLGGSTKGKGICVGSPLQPVGLAAIQITDEPIPRWSEDLLVPQGTIGELVVWGDNVSRRYDQRPQANASAKIECANGQMRHRTGDVGYLDEAGRVWFCGRKAHRVLAEQGVLYTVPCEGVFNAHPLVHRTALVGLGTEPQRPVLCVELEKGVSRRLRKRIRAELLELGCRYPHTREIRTILFHSSFPVDIRHNAKIFREKLALWAEKKLT